MGTGAVYAQIVDCCFPGEVAVSKLNWKARLEWEFTNNFKVLQQAFQKLKVAKHVEVSLFMNNMKSTTLGRETCQGKTIR